MEIDAETLRQWLEAARPVTVLDVRPADQRAEWSIPGSLHADVYEALKAGDESVIAALPVPGDRPVVTICAMGRTSRKAAEILARKGLQAFSLQGGMQAWSLAWNVADIALGMPGVNLLQIRRAGKGCLSYLLASDGEALVVDPSLGAEVYLELAATRGVRIRAVLDTHVHADHVSRAGALAVMSGASNPQLLEGETLRIGSLMLKTLHTPGHTPESRCYLVEDRAMFTGDTLFLDSVGRPDLLAGLDPEQQSRVLYASLRRLLDQPDNAWVLPAHAPFPPPFDGVPIAATLGDLRRRNRYLRATEPEFLAMLQAGTNAPPPNFETIVEANRTGVTPEGDWISLEAGPNRCARA